MSDPVIRNRKGRAGAHIVVKDGKRVFELIDPVAHRRFLAAVTKSPDSLVDFVDGQIVPKGSLSSQEQNE